MGYFAEVKTRPVMATVSTQVSLNVSSQAGRMDMWFCALVLGWFFPGSNAELSLPLH